MLNSGGKLWGIPHSKKALDLEPALFLSILGSLDSPDPENKPRFRIAGVWETSTVLLPAIYPIFHRGYLMTEAHTTEAHTNALFFACYFVGKVADNFREFQTVFCCE